MGEPFYIDLFNTSHKPLRLSVEPWGDMHEIPPKQQWELKGATFVDYPEHADIERQETRIGLSFDLDKGTLSITAQWAQTTNGALVYDLQFRRRLPK